MTPTKLHSQLPIISYLFDEKRKRLDQIVNNLQLSEVKEDAAFTATTERIKRQHILEAVVLGEPVIQGHRTQTKKVGTTAWGQDRIEEVITATVNVPFTGSPELFSYLPNGFSYSSSDTDVFQPNSNTITLEVDVNNLDKDAVMEKINRALRTTRRLITQANSSIVQWSAEQEKMIDEQLAQKRTEILKFYS